MIACADRMVDAASGCRAELVDLSDVEDGLARELQGRVLVNCLAPGFFASEMSSVLADEQLESIVRRTPTGQLTTAELLLAPLDLLLAPGTNLNGETIVVDGGASA